MQVICAVSFLASVLSVTIDERSYCKNETIRKLLMYLRFDGKLDAELSAIAEGSAPILGTTVHGAGSAVGRIDPTPWEQEHTALEVSQRLLAYAGGVSPLSCFESLEVNAQGFDFRFERLPRQAQLGRRAGGAGHPAAALGQGGFDQERIAAIDRRGPGGGGVELARHDLVQTLKQKFLADWRNAIG